MSSPTAPPLPPFEQVCLRSNRKGYTPAAGPKYGALGTDPRSDKSIKDQQENYGDTCQKQSSQGIREEALCIGERSKEAADWEQQSRAHSSPKDVGPGLEAETSVQDNPAPEMPPSTSASGAAKQAEACSAQEWHEKLKPTSKPQQTQGSSSGASVSPPEDAKGKGRPGSQRSSRGRSVPWDRRRGWGGTDKVSMLTRIQDLAEHLRHNVSMETQPRGCVVGEWAKE